MAQTRFWEYKQDDKTIWLSQQLVGIIPPGLYRGFDFDSANSSGNDLVLFHDTTGYKDTKLDQSLTNFQGVARTKQGVTVIEDEPITITVSGNASSDPRIDLVVMEHEYVDGLVGGNAATYIIIQGSPNASPVAPALDFPNKQVILGRIYWPGSTTDIGDAGVVYAKEAIPNLAAQIDALTVMTLNTSTDKLSASVYAENYYIANTNSNYEKVSSLSIPNLGGVNKFYVYTLQKLDLFDNGSNTLKLDGGVTHMYVEAGEVLEVWNIQTAVSSTTPVYKVVKGTEASLNALNKYLGAQVWSRGTATVSAADGTITLDKKGNYYEVSIDFSAMSELNGISSFKDLWNGTDTITKDGAIVVLRIVDSATTGNALPIKHGASGLSSSFDLIATQTGADIDILSEGYLMLIQTFNGWRILSHADSRTLSWKLYDTITAATHPYEHNYTKIQTTGWKDLGTGGFNTSTGVLEITDDGNSFVVSVPMADAGGVMVDIKVKRGSAAAATLPDGTIVNVRFVHTAYSALFEPFNISLDSGTSNIRSMVSDNTKSAAGASNSLHIIDGATTVGDVITFRKSNGKWDIISLMHIADLYPRVKTLEAKVLGAWQTGISLGTNWVNATAGAPRYRKNGDGLVQLSGGIKINASGASTTAFTLASGYRPTSDEYFACPLSTTSADCATVVIEASTGNVNVYLTGGLNAFSGASIYLAGISFYNS